MTTDDDRLEQGFGVVAPQPEQVQWIERRLESVIDAPQQSLFQEWIELLRIRPLVHGGMTILTAGILGVFSPALQLLAWMARTAAG